MKKLITLLAIISMASCKKTYTCKCNYSAGGVSSQVTITYKEVKKSYAKQACSDRTETSTYGSVSYSTCKLQD